MEDACVVKVVGTFIDFSLKSVSQKKRSSSVPAGRSINPYPSGGQQEYMSSLVDQINVLLGSSYYVVEKQFATSFESDKLGGGKDSELTSSTLSECCTGADGGHSETDSCNWPPTTASTDSHSFAHWDDLHNEPAHTAEKAMTQACDANGQRTFRGGLCEQGRLALTNGLTTLMLYDIPCRQTIDSIVDAINQHGFAGTYDYVYMPPLRGRRRRNSNNMGYAFVNFKQSQSAAEFLGVFQNYTFAHCGSSLKLTCSKLADCQGYDANLKKHAKMQGDCLRFF